MVEASCDEDVSDEDLLARIADEDRRAFTSLMRRHGKVVANRCLDQARRQRLRSVLPFSEAADPIDEAPSAFDELR